MKYIWQDLPKPLNCFTIRSATMVNLNNGKIVRHYSANTKIVVVQKCVTPNGTYYRTNEAAHHYLNYAFRASAFGLPDEKAPSVPSNSFSPGLSPACQTAGSPTTPAANFPRSVFLWQRCLLPLPAAAAYPFPPGSKPAVWRY